MLDHDNAPCHTAVSINELLAEKSIPVISQPSYSPDLGLCDFFLFPRLKNHLKGRHFGTLDNIQKSVTDELTGIPAEAFQHCYEQWKQRLCRCVACLFEVFQWHFGRYCILKLRCRKLWLMSGYWYRLFCQGASQGSLKFMASIFCETMIIVVNC